MNTIIPWLILHKINSVSLNQLAAELNSAAAVIAMSDQALREQGINNEMIRALRFPDQAAIEADLKWLQQNKQHHLISWEDPHYPRQLKEIYKPPLLLYIKGKPDFLNSKQIAIVGSRNPSPMGLEMARYFARALLGFDLNITSGLALGIDAESHRAALAAEGITLAVLGSGLEEIYPKTHSHLAEKIIERGALISEYAPKVKPLAYHFPQRNRIISGLSLGTLVIEAAVKSGSLITARLAAEQGREVFAVPGSPHHLLAAGCNKLIQQGAKLVNSIDDLMEELNGLLAPRSTKGSLATLAQELGVAVLDNDQLKLLECVGFETSSIDQIAERSSYSAETTSSQLLALELKGYISTNAGGYIRIASPHQKPKME